MSAPATEEPEHTFIGYYANPHICQVCGAVRPMPCYRVKKKDPEARR